MTDVLQHRGPDARGQLELDVISGGRVGLGHRRLAIIDLSPGGNQPMSRGQLHIVFNGEIYNYRELRDELVQLGRHFVSHGDTEVILASVEEWGLVNAVSKFNGMFAFALYDTDKSRLFLVRDRAGVKPLYYCHQHGLVLFASELKSFHQHPEFDSELSNSAITAYFRYGYLPSQQCIYKNARKVLPSHIVEIDLVSGREQVSKYWDIFDAFNQPKLKLDVVEVESELETLLTSAVHYRMVSDVPVGVFLSGGYDSSLVTALLQRGSRQRVRTFTIGFEDSDFDEAPFARAIAAHLGTDHTEHTCSAREAQEIIPTLAEYFDEPFGDSSAIPTILVSRVARQSVKVALSADAGDELFGGYNKYAITLKILKVAERLPRLFQNARLLTALCHFPMPGNFGSRTLHNLKSAVESHNDSVSVMHDNVQVFRADQIKQLLGERWQSDQAGFDASGLDGHHDAIARMLAIDYKTYLPDDILTKVDRATMSVSLEGREPLLDFRLAEFASRLPSELKITDTQRKHILKRLTHKYVPKPLLDRPKKGFSVPYFRWLRGDLRYLLDDYLSPTLIKEQGLLNPRFVTRFRDRFAQGDERTNVGMWNLLMFQMWWRRWVKSHAS